MRLSLAFSASSEPPGITRLRAIVLLPPGVERRRADPVPRRKPSSSDASPTFVG
jgi:hypothetical protein